MRRTRDFHYKNRYRCTITIFRGTVISTQKNRTVHTRISGETTLTSSSNTKIHNEFFLRDKASGKEEAVELENWNLSLREGHDVALVWVAAAKGGEAQLAAVYNYSLGEEIWAESALPDCFQIHKPAALITLCALLWLGWLILAIALALKLGFWKPQAAGLLIAMTFILVALFNHALLAILSRDRDREICEAREALHRAVRKFADTARGIRKTDGI